MFQKLTPPLLSRGGLPTKPETTKPETTNCPKRVASERAAILLGCYRRDEVSDPEIFTRGVVAVLMDYPEEIVRRITDPRGGIPSRLKWLPTIAEVKEACETEMAPVRRRREREEREARSRALIARALPAPPEREAEIADGLQRLARELRSRFGLSDEDWAAIPDAPDPVMALRAASKGARE